MMLVLGNGITVIHKKKTPITAPKMTQLYAQIESTKNFHN